MSTPTLEQVLEVVLLAAGRALKLDELLEVLADSPIEADRAAVRAALSDLQTHWEARGLELIQVASGYRLQVRVDYAPWIARLWAERPARYSRALLETLALIAYRQPITRGEIEDIRGVAVNSQRQQLHYQDTVGARLGPRVGTSRRSGAARNLWHHP